jgi:hypothetical protein
LKLGEKSLRFKTKTLGSSSGRKIVDGFSSKQNKQVQCIRIDYLIAIAIAQGTLRKV